MTTVSAVVVAKIIRTFVYVFLLFAETITCRRLNNKTIFKDRKI